MASIFYEDDARQDTLLDRRVAVIGFGSQGHAHALNLLDSGVDVRVGLRPGSPSERVAQEHGLPVTDVERAAKEADVVVVLVPDTAHGVLWGEVLSRCVSSGDALIFGHGFSIHYGLIQPPPGVDVVMVAPKGPGHLVRRTFVAGVGTPAVIAVAQDATNTATGLAIAYGAAIGCARAGLVLTTFEEETESDLFGEQAVLCGGMPELVVAGFNVLVENGVQPEVAYLECLHELKLIVDLVQEGGLTGMRHSISDTAEFGGYTRGSRVITADVQDAMRSIFEEIHSGKFADELLAEIASGGRAFEDMRRRGDQHPIEQVGRELRRMMPWIGPPDGIRPSTASTLGDDGDR